MIFFSLYCRNYNFCITDRCKSIFDGNILPRGCLTKLENFRESQGVGGSDKQPLEWKFLGGRGGGDGGGGESKARLLRTFSRVEAL